MKLRRGERLCEHCKCPTAGFLRLTRTVGGGLVRACEDCALDLEREKAQVEQQKQGAA